MQRNENGEKKTKIYDNQKCYMKVEINGFKSKRKYNQQNVDNKANCVLYCEEKNKQTNNQRTKRKKKKKKTADI